MKAKTNWPPVVLWVGMQVALWIFLLVMVHTLSLQSFTKLLVLMVMAGWIFFTIPVIFKTLPDSETGESLNKDCDEKHLK